MIFENDADDFSDCKVSVFSYPVITSNAKEMSGYAYFILSS